MSFAYKRSVSSREIIFLSVTILIFLILFILLHIYFDIAPVPLIFIPVVSACWILGTKRGLIAGAISILISVSLVMVFHAMHGGPLLGFISIVTALALGSWVGWIRKLYDSSHRQAAMLEEEHKKLLKEIEEHKRSEERALWDEYFLRITAESSSLGMLAIDNLTHKVLFCNHKFCEIWKLENYEEQLKRGLINNVELFDHCAPFVRDSEAFRYHFKPIWDSAITELPNIDSELKDGRIIRFFTTRIKDIKNKPFGWLIVFEDVTERRRAEDMLKKRYEYEHLLHKVSDLFINSPEGITDEIFYTSLNKIGGFLGMNRGYFFRFDPKTGSAHNFYEWRSEKDSGRIASISEVNAASWPDLSETLQRNQGIIIGDLLNYTSISQGEKEFILGRNIRSLILIPVSFSNAMAGFLGFDSPEPMQMPEDILPFLHMLGNVFASALIRKQKNEALLESEERFRLLVEHSADVIVVTDKEGIIKYASPSVKDHLGVEAKDRLGKSIFSTIHPDDVEKIKDTYRAMTEVSGLPPVRHTLRLVIGDNTHIYVGSVFTGQLDNPAINGIIINARNITQHIALQEELRESSNFLNAVINRAGDPMFVKDSSHRYILVNDAFCRMMGHKREEMLGKTDYDLVTKEEADYFHYKDDLVMNSKEVQNFELTLTDPQENVHILTTNEILYQDEKGAKHVVASIRDETRRKEMEHELNNALFREKELNELKSKFISMVSHEYRTPLSTILSSTELLELFGIDMTMKERQDHLNKIKKSVEYLTDLLSDVLLLNRSESGRLEFTPATFELVDFCNDIIKSFDTATCHIKLNTNLPSKMVRMDKKLLRYIFMNLLSNAQKYSKDGCCVDFNVFFKENRVDFEIRDKGIGISAKSSSHLFEPFYRGDNALNIPGSGLGLSIVKNCVELHNGSISFESILDEGTTFRVELPDIKI